MRKGLALFLCLLMTMYATVSCGSESGEPIQTEAQTEQTSDVVTEPEEISASNILERFDKVSYDGEVFRVLGSSKYNDMIGGQQLPGPEQNGEVLNDALYLRDSMLEDYFNIDIQYDEIEIEQYSDVYKAASKNILAGDDVHDLIFGSMALVIVPLINMQGIMDFNTIPEIDLSNEWWNRNAINDLTICGKMYFATGDITTRYVTSAFVLVFNKNLFDNYQIEYPYNDVYDGSWTIDKLIGHVSGMAQDLDNDGKYTNDDFHGLVYEGGAEYSFFVGTGESVVKTNSEGIPEFNCSSESSLNAIGTLVDKLVNDDFYAPAVTYDANTIFKNSRALYLAFAGCDLTMLRDMEDDFGLVPIPKLKEAQENYYSHSNPWIATSVAIPVTVNEDAISRTATVTEAMAALSKYTSMPAQYESTMQQKHVRDTESIDMLQIAVDSTKYDLAYLFSWGSLVGELQTLIVKGGEYASRIEKVEGSVTTAMQKTIDMLNT